MQELPFLHNILIVFRVAQSRVFHIWGVSARHTNLNSDRPVLLRSMSTNGLVTSLGLDSDIEESEACSARGDALSTMVEEGTITKHETNQQDSCNKKTFVC